MVIRRDRAHVRVGSPQELLHEVCATFRGGFRRPCRHLGTAERTHGEPKCRLVVMDVFVDVQEVTVEIARPARFRRCATLCPKLGSRSCTEQTDVAALVLPGSCATCRVIIFSFIRFSFIRRDASRRPDRSALLMAFSGPIHEPDSSALRASLRPANNAIVPPDSTPLTTSPGTCWRAQRPLAAARASSCTSTMKTTRQATFATSGRPPTVLQLAALRPTTRVDARPRDGRESGMTVAART